MAVMTPEKLVRELLELHLLEDGLRCDDWSRIGCDGEVTHFVICPCGEGKSATCDRCLAKLREKARPLFFGLLARPLWFYSTCGHAAKIDECSIRPI